jgi:hypothetical protein
MKYLSVLLLALALAACDLGASSPSAEPLPSIGASSMAPDESMGADMSMGASASADASSMTGMTCEEAFAALDLADLAGVTSLDSASDLLDDTIASCGSVADWQAELASVLPLVDVSGAEAFLAARCDTNDAIGDSAVCDELDD